MLDIYPVRLDKTESRELIIGWSDGSEQRVTFQQLRDGCQCANCMEKRKAKLVEEEARDPTSLPILSMADTRPLEIVRMQPVGNYAYNIEFSDGHTSGVFTFELLRSIGNEVSS